jgi:hypothetical protein
MYKFLRIEIKNTFRNEKKLFERQIFKESNTFLT